MISLSLTLFACAGAPAGSNSLASDWIGEVAPAFSLEDVNPTSATYGESVSPDQHLDRVSAWYFGHST